jgi:hypothetical protein
VALFLVAVLPLAVSITGYHADFGAAVVAYGCGPTAPSLAVLTNDPPGVGFLLKHHPQLSPNEPESPRISLCCILQQASPCP